MYEKEQNIIEQQASLVDKFLKYLINNTVNQGLSQHSSKIHSNFITVCNNVGIVVNGLRNKISELEGKISELEGKISELNRWNKRLDDQKKDLLEGFENEQLKVQELESEIAQLKGINSEKPITAQSLSAQALAAQSRVVQPSKESTVISLIDRFNNWASNPMSVPLPKEFTYIEGEPKIRTNLSFKRTQAETRWISKSEGEYEILFPNPNLFNKMTDIGEFYSMNLSMLKEKGENRIMITEPCKILEGDYISYPGKLELL